MAVHAPVAVASTVPPFRSTVSAEPPTPKSLIVASFKVITKASAPAPPARVALPDVFVMASTPEEPVIAPVPVLVTLKPSVAAVVTVALLKFTVNAFATAMVKLEAAPPKFCVPDEAAQLPVTVAAAVAPEATVTISLIPPTPKSLIVSVSAVAVKVSIPASPIMVALPEVLVKVSATAVPVIVLVPVLVTVAPPLVVIAFVKSTAPALTTAKLAEPKLPVKVKAPPTAAVTVLAVIVDKLASVSLSKPVTATVPEPSIVLL